MLSTEQAERLVSGLVALARRTDQSRMFSGLEHADTLKSLVKLQADLVALLTGSSRIDRPAVDPNTETQLVEAVQPGPPKKQPSGYMNGHDEWMKPWEKYVDDARDASDPTKGANQLYHVLFTEITRRQLRLHDVLVHYVGCEPEKLLLRGRDLLHMVVDLGLFMRALGGPWDTFMDGVDAAERERAAQVKFAARSMENEAKPMLTEKKETA